MGILLARQPREWPLPSGKQPPLLQVPYATMLHSTSPSCSTHYRQAYMEQRHRPRTSDCCPRRAANSFPKFIVVSQCSQVQSYKALPSYRSTLVAVLLPRLLMCTDAPYTAVLPHLVLPICVMGKMGVVKHSTTMYTQEA